MNLDAFSRTPRTLYVSRRLLNSHDLIAWAKDQGFTSHLEPDDFHVTVAYSKTPIDWMPLGREITMVKVTGGGRKIERLGKDGDAVVLRFSAPALDARWQAIRDGGASWDHDGYKPHVTITYKGEQPEDTEPYSGPLIFGPERFEEVKEDWSSSISETD